MMVVVVYHNVCGGGGTVWIYGRITNDHTWNHYRSRYSTNVATTGSHTKNPIVVDIVGISANAICTVGVGSCHPKPTAHCSSTDATNNTSRIYSGTAVAAATVATAAASTAQHSTAAANVAITAAVAARQTAIMIDG